MQNKTFNIYRNLSNYINTKKENVVNKVLKNPENQFDTINMKKILVDKTFELNFMMDSLRQEKSSTKLYIGLAIQFFITKFAVVNADFLLVKKEKQCVSLPNTVKYYDLSYLVNCLSNNLNLNLDLDLVKAEFNHYLNIKLTETHSKLHSDKLEKHQEKYEELLLDLEYLKKGKVSKKIAFLALRYIISHRLFLLAVNRKYLTINSSKKMLTFYNVAETVNELNTHLNNNQAA